MITNKTGKFKLSETQKFARNVFTKGLGLMWHARHDYGLVFPFRQEAIIPLTMWFVFYPIDVLFLDKDWKVVEIKRNFQPFTNYTPKCMAMYVIEFRTGKIGKTKIGDKIEVC